MTIVALALSLTALLTAASYAPRHVSHSDSRLAEDFITVRVLASSSLKEIDVYAPNSDLLITFDDEPSSLRVLPQGERTTILVAGGGLRLRHATSGGNADRIKLESSTGHVLSIAGENQGIRTYRGELVIRADTETGTLTLVNRVNIEEYVSSVVASEYGLRDIEGAKAMAVVARTYALRSRSLSSAAKLHPDYDLYDDTRAQVYRGDQSVTDQSRRATFETAGETLVFNGDLIQAVYSSSNGGKTAANESIWNGDPVPYLRGKNDPHDSISPHSNWRVEIDQDKLHETLSDRYGLRVTALQFRPPHKDGRIREVTLLGNGENKKTISGGAFRSVASTPTSQLKSTFFDVEERGNNYRFIGRGFGHGVGLSQWGAHGMALDGSSYHDILAFYYPGTNLVRQLPDQPDQNDQRLAIAIDADNTITENGESLQTSEFNRVQLGWGGGWVDLHSDAVSRNHSALNSDKRSSGEAKSLRRRGAW